MKLSDTIKRDVKLSLKTIRYEFSRYLCFFMVLFLLQGLFCSILTLYANNDRTQLAYLESEYQTESGSLYHLKLLGCNETQRALLHNIDMDQEENEEIFTLLGADVTKTTDGAQRRYDLYIRFEGETEASYEAFVSRYRTALEEEGPYVEGQTLLLSYQLERAGDRAVLILQLTMVVVFGALAVWVLHSIMTNHYKFNYGVYMAFGANFLRLFRTAIWEMVWAALFTWLPAVGLANLFCWLIFRDAQLGFSVSVAGCLLTLLISLLTVGIAVFASIKTVSRKPPVRHLIADDNSNLIHSPRRSKQLIGTTFPGGLGWLSFGRYWKYGLRLLAMTLSFAMFFVGAITLGNCYQRMLDDPRPLYQVNFSVPDSSIQYDPSMDKEEENEETQDEDSSSDAIEEGSDGSDLPLTEEAPATDGTSADESEEEETPPVDYASYGYTDEVAKVFAEMPHLGAVYKESYYPARGIRSHVELEQDSVGWGVGGLSVGGSRNTEKQRVVMNVNYQAMDEEVIEAFEFLGYGVKGDLYSVLTKENTIAVTEGFLGSSQFDWEIGDTVLVGIPTAETLEAIRRDEKEMMFVTDELQLLHFYYSAGEYNYYAFTVGAIVSDFPTDANWSIFFSSADYETVTGYAPVYEALEIYAEKGATEEEEEELYEYLRKAQFMYPNMSVTDLNTRDTRQIDENKNYTGVFTLFAAVLLAVSPMVWVFAQILFYHKRRDEFELYLSVGAPLQSIRDLMLQDALRYAGISAGFFLVLAPPVSWLVHRIIGNITVLLGGEMLASFKLPWGAYLIGALVSALCGLISTMIPYILYQKQDSPLRRSGAETSTKEDTVHE